MQYKVPQNVDIEDKVIAGLTLRQFMFILVAGGFVLLEYYFLSGALGFLFFPVAFVTAGIGVAFAFVKVNDRPFEIFITSATKTLISPRTRVWRKDDDEKIPKQTMKEHPKEIQKKKKDLAEVKSSLEQLATIVDSGGTAEALAEEERKTNIKPVTKQEPSNLTDVLENTEKESPTVDKYLSEAKTFVEKSKKNAEPKLSQVARAETKPDDFKYEKIKLASEEELAETLREIEQKEEKEDEVLKAATIRKRPKVDK